MSIPSFSLLSSLFRELDLRPSADLIFSVTEDVSHMKDFVRNSAAAALGSMLPHFPALTGDILALLLNKYSQNVEVRP